MGLASSIARETLWMLVVASPYLLLGLLIAGLLHVLLPQSLIVRWMGRHGLSGVALAAAVGVPLPICSCGVVPVAVELKRKGAATPAALSFLITTPESSIDSVLLTWGMLGPLMAIARPIAAFASAMLGGVLSIAFLGRERRFAPRPTGPGAHRDWAHPDHEHEHAGAIGNESAAAGKALRAAFARLLGRRGEGQAGDPPPPGLWRAVARPALRHGFVDLLDDLAFWLIFGLVVAGVAAALLPADLGELGLGRGLVPMLILLAVGIPLYMCASASTPVAAALMVKGVSPGAALVFLLAGPATNVATILLLGRTFGRRFVAIYLTAVAVGAIACGLALDALAGPSWTPKVIAAAAESHRYSLGDWVCFAIAMALLAWRLWKGAARRGWEELKQGFAPLTAGRSAAAPEAPGLEAASPEAVGLEVPDHGRRPARRWAVAALLLVLLAYLASGLAVVPPEASGYGFVFGALTARDLGPGLHYLPPAPFGRLELRATSYPRKADVGYRTDLGMLRRRRELALFANPDEWHSTVAAMNTDPESATYLTADGNLVEMSFTVHYTLAEPAAFFYRLAHDRDLVGLYAAAAARQAVAGRPLEQVLTAARRDLEREIGEALAAGLAALDLGIAVDSVRIVDLHPPGAVVEAFRDVSSAREDRETRVHRAHESAAAEVPQARGEAAQILAAAEATSAAATLEAEGRAQGFMARAGALGGARRLLFDLLRREQAERSLAGRDKVILPPGKAPRGVTLWQGPPPAWSASRAGGSP